jgi:hypothetical protein
MTPRAGRSLKSAERREVAAQLLEALLLTEAADQEPSEEAEAFHRARRGGVIEALIVTGALSEEELGTWLQRFDEDAATFAHVPSPRPARVKEVALEVMRRGASAIADLSSDNLQQHGPRARFAAMLETFLHLEVLSPAEYETWWARVLAAR